MLTEVDTDAALYAQYSIYCGQLRLQHKNRSYSINLETDQAVPFLYLLMHSNVQIELIADIELSSDNLYFVKNVWTNKKKGDNRVEYECLHEAMHSEKNWILRK